MIAVLFALFIALAIVFGWIIYLIDRRLDVLEAAERRGRIG